MLEIVHSSVITPRYETVCWFEDSYCKNLSRGSTVLSQQCFLWPVLYSQRQVQLPFVFVSTFFAYLPLFSKIQTYSIRIDTEMLNSKTTFMSYWRETQVSPPTVKLIHEHESSIQRSPRPSRPRCQKILSTLVLSCTGNLPSEIKNIVRPVQRWRLS